MLVEHPDLFDAADDDEEADEEENGRPLHFGEHLVEVDAAQQEEQHRAEHGDRSGLIVQHAVQEEAEDGQREHEERSTQQLAVAEVDAGFGLPQGRCPSAVGLPRRPLRP